MRTFDFCNYSQINMFNGTLKIGFLIGIKFDLKDNFIHNIKNSNACRFLNSYALNRYSPWPQIVTLQIVTLCFLFCFIIYVYFMYTLCILYVYFIPKIVVQKWYLLGKSSQIVTLFFSKKSDNFSSWTVWSSSS